MLANAVRDPLFAFILLGAAIFLVSSWRDNPDDLIINVSEGDITRLKDQWSSQMRRPPNDKELRGLITNHIKEEIYHREALALGLDHGDAIVRRRLVQKLTFLTEDLEMGRTPDEPTLITFYKSNRERYQQPPQITFRHRYFSADRPRATGRPDAFGHAEAALIDERLQGDPFMLQQEYTGRSIRDIANLFGRDFADTLSHLKPEDTWQGPIRSAYGWHVVMLIDKQPARALDFETVKNKVALDWQDDQRDLANARYYQELAAKYTTALPPSVSALLEAP
ncbi:MAG TPA: hypothetical protein DDZ38_09780 [Gammaproteobacteria bacterium]|nr:hypothetical protein [Gammaproteobacteria bacterium]